LRLPEKLEAIGDACFVLCKNLKGDLLIPENVKAIGKQAFQCNGFEGKLQLPKGLRSIGASAFYGCKFTGRLELPDEIEVLPYSVFYQCRNFESLKLPAKIKYICENAFAESTGFSNALNLPEGLEIIGNMAFLRCEGMTGDLRLPKSLKSIGISAFMGCKNISSLIFGEELLNIKERAFYECEKLSGELILPKKLAYIGERAFAGCKEISGVRTGEEIMSIGPAAFSYCDNLKQICFDGRPADYYREDENQPSFPEKCQLLAQEASLSDSTIKAEKILTAFDSWKDIADKKAASEEASFNANPMIKAYDWTSAIDDCFWGLGKYADITLKFADAGVNVLINGRNFTTGSYTADRNSEEHLIKTDRLYIRSGRISELKLIDKFNEGKFLKAEIELFDGGTEDIVFSICSEEKWYI